MKEPKGGSVPVQLGPRQLTMLIPLWGRAEATRRRPRLFSDAKAVEIVESLDFDFSKWQATKTALGSVLRTRMFDQDVADFVRQNPDGTVVELGCGLNTRFERVDNGRVQWIDLDLPEVIELRKQFFDEGPRRRMFSADVTNNQWLDNLDLPTGPCCFVSEAMLIYLDPEQATTAIQLIAGRLDEAVLILDTTPRAMVNSQHRHDTLKHLPRESWFRWACDEPRTLESHGLQLERSRSLLDADRDLIQELPISWRILWRFGQPILKPWLDGYRINVFQCSR
ncbi:class I SAM-dependent methyltransferase [Stratiformator vulcanicus]|uniref:Leucine carboxyl methyltransferase n=1 Tax=Stratiformator vulcanicus TaxID=2527980 RepID=A0A517R224_9PLAN|nr:class I SAM-dependent methyltransferase [Stratiformator vulcanicus]QDT37904.1 Leucine carboxyl methyltransferase [Stratiformator vulcanicus]